MLQLRDVQFRLVRSPWSGFQETTKLSLCMQQAQEVLAHGRILAAGLVDVILLRDKIGQGQSGVEDVSFLHLVARYLVCRLLLEKQHAFRAQSPPRFSE